jgi:excisionase family DNA binding protein
MSEQQKERPMARDLLDYMEASFLLSINMGTLRSLVAREQIPFFRVGARMVRFDRGELMAWIEEGRYAKREEYHEVLARRANVRKAERAEQRRAWAAARAAAKRTA